MLQSWLSPHCSVPRCFTVSSVPAPAGHEVRQMGLALQYLRRRTPVRPLRLAADLDLAGPGEALAANTDAVAQGAAIALNEAVNPRADVGNALGPDASDESDPRLDVLDAHRRHEGG